MKAIKFASDLVPLVISGEKTSTWRLFDDKDLRTGDLVEFWNKQTMEKFAQAELVSVVTKTLGELTDEDMDGHNPYRDAEEMYHDLQQYYSQKIGPKSEVKVIRYKLLQYY